MNFRQEISRRVLEIFYFFRESPFVRISCFSTKRHSLATHRVCNTEIREDDIVSHSPLWTSSNNSFFEKPVFVVRQISSHTSQNKSLLTMLFYAEQAAESLLQSFFEFLAKFFELASASVGFFTGTFFRRGSTTFRFGH